jgi:hypothetical protein
LVVLEVEPILLLVLSLEEEAEAVATSVVVAEELIPIVQAQTVAVVEADLALSMQQNSQHLSTLQAFNQLMELRVFPTTLDHPSLPSLVLHLQAKQRFQYSILPSVKVLLD